MPEIIVIGGSGHAKVLISILKKCGYAILGYVDPNDHGAVLGVQRLGDDETLPGIHRRHPSCQAAIGIGIIEVNSGLRLGIQQHLEALGYTLPAIVSPHAIVNEDVTLGPGTVVFDGAVVNSGTWTGRGCILNSNSTVEHDCRLGDNVHIAPGATLSGGVILGDHCMVGAGATIIQTVHVTHGCLIGAGAIVVHDLYEPGTYAGNPVRKIK